MRSDPRTADELLEALSREKGLRGRVRLLGRSIELLRRLAPEERERVAMRVGSRLLWERLERSFLADGELSPAEHAAREALERMGSADPGQLRELARRVRERDAAGLRDLALGTIVEALEEEAEARALAPAAAAAGEEVLAPFPVGVVPFEAPAVGGAKAPGARAEPGASATAAAAAAAARAAAASLARATRPAPGTKAVEPGAAAPTGPHSPIATSASVPSTAPPVAARQPERPAARPAPPAPPRTEPAPRREPAPAPNAPAPVACTEPPPAPTAPDAAPLSPRDRLRTLRALQGDLVAVRALGRDGRRALVARLGGGWASRRALSRMIAARALEDLDEALALLAAVDSPVARTWCLGDLLEGWPLAPGEVERVLAAAPSEAARRRLERRIVRPGASLLAPR